MTLFTPAGVHHAELVPVTVNDEALTTRLAAALDRTRETDPRMGSEDFGLFGTAAGVPPSSGAWGAPPMALPGTTHHGSRRGIEPTLSAGVDALVTAVRDVLPAA